MTPDQTQFCFKGVPLGNKNDCKSVSPSVEKRRQLLGDGFAGGSHRMFPSPMIFELKVVA